MHATFLLYITSCLHIEDGIVHNGLKWAGGFMTVYMEIFHHKLHIMTYVQLFKAAMGIVCTTQCSNNHKVRISAFELGNRHALDATEL